jgi:deazaflavin-dependent oxidoreductase (nitroreductase family)
MRAASLPRPILRAVIALHRELYSLSGGRILGRLADMPVLLLSTTGRRTGRRRTTPLTFFRDGDDLVVVASNGGSDRPPGWYVNLVAEPHAAVRIGRAETPVTARTASPAERERLWPVIASVHPGYATYQRRTTRLIPVVLLTPGARPEYAARRR